MPIPKIIERIFDLPKSKKIYAGIFLTGFTFILVIFYLNFIKLQDYYYEQVKEKNVIISTTINKSLNVYKEILATISAKLSSSYTLADRQKISSLLRQFYLSKSNTDKINFSDIRFFDATNKVTVNRYGTVKTATELPDHITTKLQTFPSQMFMVEASDSLNLTAGYNRLSLLTGVVNSGREYIGYLAILPDFENWIQTVKQQINESWLIVVITDKENRVLYATDHSLNGNDSNFIEKQNDSRYCFTNTASIQNSSFFVISGYNKRHFWITLQNTLLPQFLVLIITCLFSAIFFWCFKKNARNEIKEQFSDTIATLATDNENYKNNIDKLTAEFSDQEKLYKSKLEFSNGLLEAHKISDLECNKLFSAIHKNISASLLEIQGLACEILQSKKGMPGFKLQQSEEVEVLTKIEDKIENLASFCITDNNNEANIEEIVSCLARVYAKEIFKKNLNFRFEIKSDSKTINFNHLLFYQILASLLYISIDAARPKGRITVEVFKKKVQRIEKAQRIDMLTVLIKDDGFYLRENSDGYGYLFDNTNATSNPYLFRINSNAIKELLEAYGCSISTTYTKDGKSVELILPCGQIYNKKEMRDNVVLFKRP